jgi:hypothetical protein
MPYPRLLKFSPEVAEKLISYLTTEMNNHYAERDPWIQDLLQWQKDYWSKPITQRATFPFTGASTLIIPLTAIAVEAIHARNMTSLFATDEFVNAKPKTSEYNGVDVASAAHPLEVFVNHTLAEDCDIYKFCDNTGLEFVKYGTCVGKSGYERISKWAVRELGEIEQEVEVVIKDGATVDAVSVGRFLMPFMSQHPQTAPWCGEEHTNSPYEVKLMEQSGMLYPGTYEELLKFVTASPVGVTGFEREFQASQEQLEDRNPVFPKFINYQEIWLSFDTDGTGREKEIQVLFHRPSRRLMAAFYNQYSDLHRPYRYGNFFSVEHRWAGIGVGKQNEQFQREITMIHRQQLDQGTLANMGMLKVHKMSGYGPREPVFPGKMWFLDDMTHIEPFKLSEPSQSSFANEQSSLIYSQQRSGINELTLGMPQQGTPGTATSDITRLQEGKAKSDFALKSYRKFLGSIVTDVLCVTKDYSVKSVQFLDTMENGDLVKQLLSLPTELFRKSLLYDINPVSQINNKALDRQNWQQVAQLLQQYYTAEMQIVEMTRDPQLMQLLVQKILIGGTEAMKQLLETYDIRNIDRILPVELLNIKAANATTGAAPGANGTTRPAIPSTASGVVSTPENAASIIPVNPY